MPETEEDAVGMLNRPELERRLGFHPGTPATAPLYEANRAGALELAQLWDDSLPPGREAALAQTALQEALMWANAAVATNLAPLGAERTDGAERAAALHVQEDPELARLVANCPTPQLHRTSSACPSCPYRDTTA